MISNHKLPKYIYLKRNKSKHHLLELSKLIVLMFLLILIPTMGLLSLQMKIYADELPSQFKIKSVLANKGENSKIFDRNGELLYVFKDPIQDREYADFVEIPPTVIAAALAAEDSDFYIHNGIDYLGTLNGVITTLSTGGSTKVGGSTITQQLMKQTILTDERTVERKVKEAITAIMVEEAYTKNEILEFYLNTTSYGGRVVGIKTAARTYFKKDVSELNLNEAAFLVSLVQSPGEYSPLFSNDKQRATELVNERRQFVIDQVLDNPRLVNYLNSENLEDLTIIRDELRDQEDSTYNLTNIAELKTYMPKISDSEDFILAPHFVFYIRDILSQAPYNLSNEELYSGGYEIYTSLNLEIQKMAERKVKEGVDVYGWQYGFQNGALVTIDAQTGEILAMAGSKGYNLPNDPNNKKFDPKVNVAVAKQSLGSSLKPWVAYLSAFHGYNPYSVVSDTRQTFQSTEGPYTPKNSDNRFMGEMSLERALILSRNLPFLKISYEIGDWRLPDLMSRVGYKGTDNYGLAATIGGVDETLLDHTAAYTGFANGSRVIKQVPVLEIYDSSGTRIFTAKKGQTKFNMTPRATNMVNGMLGNKRYGYGANGNKFIGNYKLAGKTGTSDNNRDTYYMGYGPKFVTGVWCGNNDNSPMAGNSYGVNTALPIWNSYTRELLDRFPQYREYGSY